MQKYGSVLFFVMENALNYQLGVAECVLILVFIKK